MKYGLIIIAAVVLASGCIHSDSSKTGSDIDQPSPDDTSAPSENTEQTNTVYYTDDGFVPQTVEIETGETVTWINNASRPMWVGSDNHPRHTQYSGSSLLEHCQGGDQNIAAFDQCSEGDRFSFSFEKQGEWGYHNHKFAGDSGAVVVN